MGESSCEHHNQMCSVFTSWLVAKLLSMLLAAQKPPKRGGWHVVRGCLKKRRLQCFSNKGPYATRSPPTLHLSTYFTQSFWNPIFVRNIARRHSFVTCRFSICSPTQSHASIPHPPKPILPLPSFINSQIYLEKSQCPNKINKWWFVMFKAPPVPPEVLVPQSSPLERCETAPVPIRSNDPQGRAIAPRQNICKNVSMEGYVMFIICRDLIWYLTPCISNSNSC